MVKALKNWLDSSIRFEKFIETCREITILILDIHTFGCTIILFGCQNIDQHQTIQNNVTRFVVIQKVKSPILEKKINKASLKFILDHQRGSLAALLNMMSDCLLNLTKIQSLPVIETPGKYAFFVDVTFDSYDQYDKAKSIFKIMASEFKILGEYTKQDQ